ncbi:hypothetical protein [Candidatus Atelocyanobacterium thalassae]|uniref:hypothetical protein n=1 Tax=Candidatus Atelocyanobacterium thalassae TaxID=713887 RepID=UPI001E5DA29B|nr:hypothetical protein [Candidatus Atelocyanobacterium thalassa]
MLSLSRWGIFIGLRRSQDKTIWTTVDMLRLIIETLWRVLYMMHRFIIIPRVTGRMSVKTTHLKWIKTIY